MCSIMKRLEILRRDSYSEIEQLKRENILEICNSDIGDVFGIIQFTPRETVNYFLFYRNLHTRQDMLQYKLADQGNVEECCSIGQLKIWYSNSFPNYKMLL